MRWSETLINTLRDDPQEAEIPSHKLMLRAGLMRRLAGGLYTFLPLGMRALRKVEHIVREEMDRAGALELLMPALQPREIWDQSKRYDLMGPVMFRLKDRQDRAMVLGPTHEEVITDLAARELSSYRQLPKTFYQIQTKFRDEIRPRFGLMRAKEFIMKDAYSFDRSSEAADESYQKMYNAYIRIFQRCGLRTKIVEADTGAMGGKWSHEFMVLAEAGEDGLVECESCTYAANLEKAERSMPVPTPLPGCDQSPAEVNTPNVRTIEQVAAFLKCPPGHLIKTLIYISSGRPLAALVPGDRDINEIKLSRALSVSDLHLADNATIEHHTRAPVGFAGPVGLTIPIYADSSLKGASGLISGANKADTHLLNVNLHRDATITAYADICTTKSGDACPRCQAKLQERRGIEVGHVFKLGTKYSQSFSASFLDEQGKANPMIMGCYGIGVTRTLQAVVEQSHDDRGIIWPINVAPYEVLLAPLNPSHAETMETASRLALELERNGFDVLVDDRDERPGVKFADADLLGIPIRVVVSERSLAKQSIEVKIRSQKAPELVPLAEAQMRIGAIRKSMLPEPSA